jgi:predicted ArsR family transcriptional regulator
LQGTKGEILRLLKREGPASADDIAARLGLAGMTVRQHLTGLERDALVEVCTQRRGNGRPSRLYQLSMQGDATFPRSYDALARSILLELSMIEPSDLSKLGAEERIALVLARCADRAAETYLDGLRGCDLAARASRTAEILADLSGIVDVEQLPDGIAIRDYNCAYRKVAGLGTEACPWHSRFLSRLLGCEVCWRAEARDDCCSVLVPLTLPQAEPLEMKKRATA